MGSHVIAAVLCVLAMGYGTAGDLAIVVDNLDITPGITSSLTVNCTFSFDDINPIFDFKYIVNVVLSYSPDNVLQHYADVAKLQWGDPVTVTELKDLNATSLTGQMLSNGDSYLALQWDNPAVTQAGYYRCQSQGLGSDAMLRLLTKQAQVTANGGSVVG